jgi:anti-sigma factor (TIGR02949 family)
MKDLACEEALALMMDYLKRELPAEVADTVQRHLDECRPCDQHARFETTFVLTIERRLSTATCPEKVREQILEALREEGG